MSDTCVVMTVHVPSRKISMVIVRFSGFQVAWVLFLSQTSSSAGLEASHSTFCGFYFLSQEKWTVACFRKQGADFLVFPSWNATVSKVLPYWYPRCTWSLCGGQSFRWQLKWCLSSPAATEHPVALFLCLWQGWVASFCYHDILLIFHYITTFCSYL